MANFIEMTSPSGETTLFKTLSEVTAATSIDANAIKTSINFGLVITGYRFKRVKIKKPVGRPKSALTPQTGSKAKNVKIRIDPALHELVVAQAAKEGLLAEAAFMTLLEHAIREHFEIDGVKAAA